MVFVLFFYDKIRQFSTKFYDILILKGGINVNNYIINVETLLIVPYGREKSKIFENDRTFIINETTCNILKNSCLFFGSSIEGRREAVKHILEVDMKVPIIVENIRDIIFFPVSNCIKKNSTWISYQNLLKYTKFNEFSTVLNFRDNVGVKVDVKCNLIDNQVVRCLKIDTILSKRKMIVRY